MSETPAAAASSTASTSAGSIVVRLLASGERLFQAAIGPSIASRAAVDVEVVDAEVVREQQRDVPLEVVELGPRVLADREQDVHAEVRVVDDRRELGGETREPLAVALVGVVLEVLLELVEHDEQRAARARSSRAVSRRASPGRRGAARAPAELLQRDGAASLHSPDIGSSRHDANTQTRTAARRYAGAGLLAQAVDDARLQQRASSRRRSARRRSSAAPSAGSRRRSRSPSTGRRRRRRRPRRRERDRRTGSRARDGRSVAGAGALAHGAAPPARRRQPRLEPLHVLAQLAVDELDVLALLPERLLDLALVRVGRLALHRPRLAHRACAMPQIRFRITRRFQSLSE